MKPQHPIGQWSATFLLVLKPALLGLDQAAPTVVRDVWNGSRTWRLKTQPELPVTVPASGVLFLRYE